MAGSLLQPGWTWWSGSVDKRSTSCACSLREKKWSPAPSRRAQMGSRGLSRSIRRPADGEADPDGVEEAARGGICSEIVEKAEK